MPGVMPKNLPALHNIFSVRNLFFALMFILAVLVMPDDFEEEPLDLINEEFIHIEIATARWYRSNSSGMIMEYVPSRLVALRNEYCISIEEIHPYNTAEIVPALLLPYHEE